jgi:hypothetical protein
MAEYRFILDKSSKKHVCPDCNKRTFVRYIDIDKNEYLPEQYGRCDRESKCSYHLNPYSDGYAKWLHKKEQPCTARFIADWQPRKYFKAPQPPKAPAFIPIEVLNETLKPERYSQNVFIQNLLNRVAYPFHAKDVEAVTSLYYLGTIANGYRAGAITFPFIDITNNIRAVQVKQFDETNHTLGKADKLDKVILNGLKKENRAAPTWLTEYIEFGEKEGYYNCLFGEHLLKRYPNNPIGLVEAPKTAIYCSLYFGFPETPNSLIWLAVYNKSSFTFDKLKALQGRNVFVFPDLSKDGKTFAEWQGKAKEYEQRLKGTRFVFSDLLEQLAPESDKYNGNDIADYLIKLDWRQFRTEQPAPDPAKTEVCKKSEAPKKHLFFRNKETTPRPKPKAQPKISLSELQRQWYCLMLEAQFKGEPQPENTLKLGRCKSVEDVKNLFTTHYQAISSKATSEMLPYLERLQTMKEVLTT